MCLIQDIHGMLRAQKHQDLMENLTELYSMKKKNITRKHSWMHSNRAATRMNSDRIAMRPNVNRMTDTLL